MMKNSILLSLVLILVLMGCGTPKEATIGVGNEGAIKIVCNPADAEVFIDGASMGEVNRYDGNPGYIKLSSGTHKVEIKKEGYAPYSRDVYSSKSLQTIEVTLRKLNR
ncbi:MAG TPA: PEGA domain-containing protein [Candidatus Wunengus sp. YC61]|uniref:PEGA domain-containing protein n=1 Tax=Candidatus Wunengus sp. YC61 TaxID=3367698 RepID=UPI004026B6C5